MGLGPLMAIYQARFLKYLHNRQLADTGPRHVWAFLGDGETDEPESLGAISLAGREMLDNLIFVVNCNLQRLDGPVRGNGKIIQELEGVFRGRRLERDQGRLGVGLGPAAGRGQVRVAAQAHGGVRRRRVPGLQVQERRVRPGALLRQVPGAAGPGQGHDRRPDLGAVPRRARPVEGLRGVQGGGGQRRLADGDPGQDGQGLRDGRGRRGPEHHPPAEEDGRERAARVPRPVRHRPARREDRRGAVPAAARGQPRAGLPAGAA